MRLQVKGVRDTSRPRAPTEIARKGLALRCPLTPLYFLSSFHPPNRKIHDLSLSMIDIGVKL